MYELNRVRLVSIGPRGARYADVTLDLSGVGQTLSASSLFDAPTRLPSPYSLLMLENGGGKSVLLKLLFSVVLPGRRKTVGGSALDKFVLDGDTGHVALEWMHVTTGQRFVTAKVYQRRSSTKSNTNPLTEAWYSFRPSDTLDLSTLPVADGERRRRLDGYKQVVDEAHRVQPQTQLVWLGDDQKGWREHLRLQDIEPDLFDLQRSMNVDEGEAANAFKFGSSQQFVDWLLRTVTDPADAVSVAETFEQWAINLAERDSMLLERDFLEGAVAGLEELADEQAMHAEAKKQASAAARRTRRLGAALDSRRSREDQAVDQLKGELVEARRAVTGRETERDAATAITNEIRRQTIEIDLRETQRDKDAASTDLTDATLELAGWETAPLIQSRIAAEAKAKAYADEIAAVTAQAAPVLQRRDEAAADLLAKLGAEVDAAVATADGHRAKAQALGQEVLTQAGLREEALGVHVTAVEQHRAATKIVTQAAADVHTAAATGLVPADATAGAIPALTESAAADRDVLVQDIDKAAGKLETLRVAARQTEKRLKGDQEQLGQLSGATRDADRSLEAVVTVATRIGALEVVVRAAGHDVTDGPLNADDVDSSADGLLTALAADLDAHTQSLDAHRAAQTEDQRILDALGDGHLLPARRDVEDSLAVLTAAGVAAMPGWRYLAESAAEDERAGLIEAHPDLVDGIVLTDPDQMSQARELLAAAQLMPSAAVAVGTGWALLREEDPNPDRFVVDPNPAMYDEAAAAQRREEMLALMSVRSTTIVDVTAQFVDVRDAHAELSLWRRQTPHGRLARLQADRAAADLSEQLAREALTALEAELAEQSAQRDDAEEHLTDLRRQERAASDRHRDLELLAAKVAAAREAAANLPDLLRDAEEGQQAADTAGRRRDDAAAAVVTQTSLARDADALADRFRQQAGDIQSSTSQPSGVVPTRSVAELRATYEAEQEAYLQAAVDVDLRDKADIAAGKVRDLLREIDLRDRRHIAEAERLLATAAGSDRTAWKHAVTGARQRQVALITRHEALILRVGALTSDLENASSTGPSKQWVALTEQWQPTSVEHGRTLGAQARVRQRVAQDRVEEANSRVASLDGQRSTAEQAAVAFRDASRELEIALESVTELPRDLDPVDAFDGTAAAAAQQAEQARADLRDTRTAEIRSKASLDRALDDLVGFANSTRFDPMPNSVRRSIMESSSSAVAERAREWASLCTGRLASLTTDIETANRHRKSIVDRLTALVDQALRTLRRAARLSRLPDSLGDWAGKEFLRISFSEPDLATIAHRVGDVVDEFAAVLAGRQGGSRSTAPKRDGLALLLDAVHAAVPKGFTVDVLKPDSVLRDERVSIEEMNDVFSGGQELTAAIVLYCTLAALKADDRGKMRAKHSGVLFLDNPIGRASASYLIDLQQGIASALGVQLIYTTGLSDDRVLAAFPMWIRMRNDADLRAGLKYIRVAEEVRRHLPTPFADDLLDGTDAGSDAQGPSAPVQPGTVTATRVHLRPPSLAARRPTT